MQTTEHLYKYAYVDRLDQGDGLLVVIPYIREKASRHRDGETYDGSFGTGEDRPLEVRVPFSEITDEIVKSAPITSGVITEEFRLTGLVPENALIFSSTVLHSASSFAAQVVDDSRLSKALRAWETHPDVLSAQTYRSNERGKTIILSVIHAASEGSR